jgi:sulfatase maturation enzyme AslB (radical SAM superfamily)
VIELGNLHHQTLNEIVNSERAQLIIIGFKEGKAVEELCRRCSYKSRFTESREALATKG